ncbi:MAG: VOC family protein [bacterium]|nr:VOC family protein [bacterium]
MFNIDHLDHVALRVRDVEASAAWYGEVLGMRPAFEGLWGGVPTMLALGPTYVALFPTGDESPDGPKTCVCMDHLAFKADAENFARAREELPARGIAVEFQDHDVSRSIYFDDPDGHRVEITTYDA